MNKILALWIAVAVIWTATTPSSAQNYIIVVPDTAAAEQRAREENAGQIGRMLGGLIGGTLQGIVGGQPNTSLQGQPPARLYRDSFGRIVDAQGRPVILPLGSER